MRPSSTRPNYGHVSELEAAASGHTNDPSWDDDDDDLMMADEASAEASLRASEAARKAAEQRAEEADAARKAAEQRAKEADAAREAAEQRAREAEAKAKDATEEKARVEAEYQTKFHDLLTRVRPLEASRPAHPSATARATASASASTSAAPDPAPAPTSSSASAARDGRGSAPSSVEWIFKGENGKGPPTPQVAHTGSLVAEGANICKLVSWHLNTTNTTSILMLNIETQTSPALTKTCEASLIRVLKNYDAPSASSASKPAEILQKARMPSGYAAYKRPAARRSKAHADPDDYDVGDPDSDAEIPAQAHATNRERPAASSATSPSGRPQRCNSDSAVCYFHNLEDADGNTFECTRRSEMRRCAGLSCVHIHEPNQFHLRCYLEFYNSVDETKQLPKDWNPYQCPVCEKPYLIHDNDASSEYASLDQYLLDQEQQIKIAEALAATAAKEATKLLKQAQSQKKAGQISKAAQSQAAAEEQRQAQKNAENAAAQFRRTLKAEQEKNRLKRRRA